jgi:hypothetical protein
MPRLLTLFIAAILLSCKGPPVKVISEFSGWPIDIDRLISSIQTSTGCKIDIRDEFKHKISPTAPSGCILFVHSQSEDRREDILNSAFKAINDSLKANGCRILSTDPTSCKTDFRFVYAGTSTHGSITLKGLSEKKGVQLIICLLEDWPNDTVRQAAPIDR